ncbi:MAG: precorrin-6y C5,15-methyltransferase (decarboxylating) subunit CbiE [candidate division NC10 bacterium]|nr:precorrin-6y C5,15-methyltransferase (decarboxylating) subunit CbiE [Candidatus Rokubacteria bacterium]MBI2563066.1 precorrin-6y C5,15-methyltransferase (decarboxylating) subunit CbiE [candidate division NC10 bacterium]
MSEERRVIHVVGVGREGVESLTPRALAIVEKAELLVGGQRLLDGFPHVPAERVKLGAKVDEVLAAVAARRAERRVVVLATGDPNYFGITRALLRHVPADDLEIVPNVSALQWAFAKAREPWDDATFLTVHGRSTDGLVEAVRGQGKVCLFTDEKNTPSAIARILLDAGLGEYRAILCEDLGGPAERVRPLSLHELTSVDAHPLNTLILLGPVVGTPEREPVAWTPGLPEEVFDQRKPKLGLITKREVRVLSLSRLALRPDSAVWDIGAGSGSVSVEAARLAPRGRVFAVEKNAEDVQIVLANVEKFGVPHVTVVHAHAPEGLKRLPDPDAVFVGGSGGGLSDILAIASARLRPRGRIVVNAITLDTLHEAVSTFRQLGLEHEAILVSIARSKPLLQMMSFEALNPVYIVTAWRAEPVPTEPRGEGAP